MQVLALETNESEKSRKFLEWFTSPEGKASVRDSAAHVKALRKKRSELRRMTSRKMKNRIKK